MAESLDRVSKLIQFLSFNSVEEMISLFENIQFKNKFRQLTKLFNLILKFDEVFKI